MVSLFLPNNALSNLKCAKMVTNSKFTFQPSALENGPVKQSNIDHIDLSMGYCCISSLWISYLSSKVQKLWPIVMITFQPRVPVS